MNIKTEFWSKPTPIRNWDWTAIDSDTYDGAPDAGPCHRCIGYGKTEAEAVADLEEQLDDAEHDRLDAQLLARRLAECDAANRRIEDMEQYRSRMEAKYCDDKAGE